MSKEGIEPRTSHTQSNHLTDCAIADVTRTYIKLVGVLQTVSYIHSILILVK
jgi:hypothetical protein